MSTVLVDHADEGGPSDIFITVVGFICAALIILCDIYILIYRDYVPFQVIQVQITLISSLAGVFWVITSPVSLNLYSRPETGFFGTCDLWAFWFQLFFGFAPWLNCLIIRSIRLYFAFFLHSRPPKWWIFLIILQIPWLIYSIVGSVYNGSAYDPTKDNCENGIGWTIALAALIVVYWIVFLYFWYKLRKQRDEFNEFKEVLAGWLLVALFGILNFIFWATKKYLESTNGNDTVSVNAKIAERFILYLSVIFCVTYFYFRANIILIWKHYRKDIDFEESYQVALRNPLQNTNNNNNSSSKL